MRRWTRWTRYPRVWVRLLRTCYTHEPRTTLVALGCRVLSLVTLPATAVAFGAAVDLGARAYAGTATARIAILAAVAVAVVHTVNQVVQETAWGQTLFLTDRVGLLAVDIEILRDICDIETMDHLERTDFLDRVTMVRDAAWQVLYGAWGALNTVLNVIRLVIVLALLGTISPYLLLLVVFGLVPLWFDARARRAVLAADEETAEAVRLQRHLFQLATTAGPGKELRVTGSGPDVADRQARIWQDAQDRQYRAHLTGAAWRVGGWAVFTAGFTGALALVVYQASRGHATVGDIVLSVTVAANLRTAVQQAVQGSTETAMAGRLIEPYLWLREYAAERRARRRGTRPAPTALRDGITLRGVTYRYPGTERDAVADVSAHLPAGSVVAVVGEYGSGKTTLVKLLCRFHEPTGGTMLIDDVDLAEVDAASWRAGMAAAFQDFGRYRARFGEAVGIGDLSAAEDPDRIAQALAAAAATSLLDRLPDGLDTLLGRDIGGVELSEGQWQKTALARACMRPEPLLFVLDEPTASLDAPSEQAIFERYMARARSLVARTGAVTIVISHRFSTVAGADLILVMDAGRLVQAGTHEELVAVDGPYAEMYALSGRAYTAPG